MPPGSVAITWEVRTGSWRRPVEIALTLASHGSGVMVGIGGIGVAVGGKGVAVGGTGVEVTTIISGGTPLVQEPERVSGFFLFSYHLPFYMPRIGASD